MKFPQKVTVFSDLVVTLRAAKQIEISPAILVQQGPGQ